jgi:murein DD-endopeptidase MepM/ murein hydrolase activator NlpD
MIIVIALLALALAGPSPTSTVAVAGASRDHPALVAASRGAPAVATVTAPMLRGSAVTPASAMIHTSAGVGSATLAGAPGWDWPLSGPPEVVRAFDPPPVPWGRGHRGVDLAGVAGEPVLTAGAGVVAFAGMVAGRGVVSVDHAGGLRTTYEPVSPTVRVGDVVGLGAPLGTLDAGHPGCPTTACLHWGLRRGDVYLNPLLLVRPLRVRLKPLDTGALCRAWAVVRSGAGVGLLVGGP